MPLHRTLLRITLCLLGAAALAAIAAVFTGNTFILWRVVFTCVEAAVATGFLLRLTRLLDRPSQRPAAILGFAILLASFALFLVGTWIGTIGPSPQNQILGTGLAVACLGGLATTCLAMRSRQEWSLAAPACAAAAGVTLIATIAAIWAESNELGAATAAAGPLLIIGALCLVGESPAVRPWRFLGAALAIAAAAIGGHQGFQKLQNFEMWNWYTVLTACAIAVMHANLLMLLQLVAPWTFARLATIAATSGAAIGVSFAALSHGVVSWDVLGEPIGRTTAAAGILAACGTLALVARQRLGKRFVIDTSRTRFDTVAVTCPRCSTKQSAPVGDSPCTGCRLLLSIRVSEPHCASCGYCLFDLTQEVCPECGQPIPARGKPLPISAADRHESPVI